MIIGSHVHYGKEQLLSSVKEAISYKADTFMFYTGAPQNSIRGAINKEYTNEAHKLMRENNINIKNVICHAPYIINLANKNEEAKWQFSVSFLRKEIDRCEELGVKYIVLHPGSALTENREMAIQNIIDGIDKILTKDDDIMILLETMAGKGTELGVNIRELELIIKGVKLTSKVGVCLDTCHLSDSGVDMLKMDNYLRTFNKYIGINKIKCIHLNDSKNSVGSSKDRHANIGFGNIGFEKIMFVLSIDEIKNVPIILETPYVDDKPPYKYEIAMLRSGKFDIDLLDKIKNS